MTPSPKTSKIRGNVSSPAASKRRQVPWQRSSETPASARPCNNSALVDLHQAAKFLEMLDPEAHTFSFQTIPEAAGAVGSPQFIHGDFASCGSLLAKLNASGHGIFVTTQRMDGGGRKASNLEAIRACWADIDARSGGVLRRPRLLPPNVVVETSPGSFHCWWMLADCPPLEQWRGVQRQIVREMRSDPSGQCDVAKVLRVPGFMHQKGEPRLVRIVESTRVRWAFAEMAEVYRPTTPSKPKPATAKPSRQWSGSAVDEAVLRSALDHLAVRPHPSSKRSTSYADDYETWMKFGLAVHRALGNDGFAMWDAFSRASGRYPGREAVRRKWDGFASADEPNSPVTLGTIFHTARRAGWSKGEAERKATLRAYFENKNRNQE